ncbi:MAG: HAD family hydrolase [Prevotella sp.]|nr:HAD family hydrolase [Prevotella sp.]
MNIQTIILDFDGTIADTQSLIVRTFQGTIRTLNLPEKSAEECAATIGLPLKQAFMTLFDITDETGNLCAETYRLLFNEYNQPGAVPPFPYVVDTIKQLYQRGIILTIATSRGRDSLMGFLEEMELTPFIAYIVTADDIRHAKPHPEPVLKTLKHLEAKAENTLVVGDTTFDIEMGRTAGCITCGVAYGNQSREQLQAANADYIIDDFCDILQIIP